MRRINLLKNFISYYKPHRGLFFLDIFAALLIAGLDLLFPWGTRLFINDIIPGENTRLLIIFAVIFVILYIFRFILDYIVTYYGHVLGVRIEYDMRKDLFAHIQKFSFKFFDDTKVGQLMSRLVNDLSEITELAHHGPEDIFISFIMIVGTFIILLSINVPLTLITFFLIPFMVYFTIKLNMLMRSNFRNMRKVIGDVNSGVEESLLGIRVVQSFANEGYEQDKFDLGNKKFKDLRSEGFKILGVFSGGIFWFSSMLTLTSLVAGGFFVFRGAINVGDLVAFVLYMGIMVQPIRKIATFAELYQRGMAGYNRFSELMRMKPEIIDRKDAIDIGKVRGEVEYRDVSFRYEDEGDFVLNNINLKVSPGETVALVGTSGVGKTTLCSLLPRFYEVLEGDILIDGTSIKDIKINSLRNNIGIVSQDIFLFSGTIAENIAYGKLDASMEDIRKAAKSAYIDDFIMSLDEGYGTFVGERGVKLSGGQKQRIAIARIFLKNPSILIFDEATSSLDVKSEKYIHDSMEVLCKDRTTFIIAHRLSTIKDAEVILVLTKDGIVERGSHRELLDKKGTYFDLYKVFTE